jgi:acyl CoA:acetate/3-ketoacid CoA transferase
MAVTDRGPAPLTPEEAVEKALLHTFQLTNKDYRKMQAAMSEVAFIRAIEQDGYTVVPSAERARSGRLEAIAAAAKAALDAHAADIRREVELTGEPAAGGAGCWCHALRAAVEEADREG